VIKVRGKGQPRTFKTAEEFYTAVAKYIKYCEEHSRLPNVAGFCASMPIHRDTYYAQKQYYSDTFNMVEDLLEDGALNSDIAPGFKQFYMKNKFGAAYKDKTEQINTNLNHEMTEEEADQILKQFNIHDNE